MIYLHGPHRLYLEGMLSETVRRRRWKRCFGFAVTGAGRISSKGTIGKKLCDEYGLEHVATGDIFRDEIKRGTECGIKANEFIRADGGRLRGGEMPLGPDDRPRGVGVQDEQPRTRLPAPGRVRAQVAQHIGVVQLPGLVKALGDDGQLLAQRDEALVVGQDAPAGLLGRHIDLDFL